MPVSDELIAQARKLNRSAAEAVLTDSYAPVWRLSHAMIGKAQPARKVVEQVFRKSLRVMPTWRPGVAPANWFYHHALLSSRMATEPPPPVKDDLLVISASNPTPDYLAFIGAVRHLPIQQREAFLLHHGEKLNERQLGVAMDSSTTAAANHLRAATATLDTVTSGKAAELAAALSAAYAKLEPTEKTVVPAIRQQVSRAIWRRRIRRLTRRIIWLTLLGAIGYWAWRNRTQFLDWYHVLRESATTQP
jgi:DNA-directed RNA polymerase specialized sigma24 family protein